MKYILRFRLFNSRIFSLLILSFVLFNSTLSRAQDSLTLKAAIKQVIETHPSVKQAEEALKISDAKIGLAKSGYYPNIDVNASYTRLGPASAITLPDLGSFDLYPLNNYNAALEYSQTIYDFGKTAKNVSYEKESKNLANLTIEEVKQKLSLMTTITFYNLAYLQDAIKIKDEQLKTLDEHLEFIQKKKETGSATQYEILSTKVRISVVESQKTDLLSSYKTQMTVLNTFLGEPENTIHMVKKDIGISLPIISYDSMYEYAYKHREEMKIAQEESTLADLNYKIVKSQNNPKLNIIADGGWKNGYFPNLNTLKANYAAGIGLRVPVFDAGKNRNDLLLAKTSIENSDLETEITKRKITNEVSGNKADLEASQKKVEQTTLQMQQAKEALALAEVSYKSGAITNLDLLDATTSLSESRLASIKSKIDYLINASKLKMAIGDRLY